jgi:hypothetical protein
MYFQVIEGGLQQTTRILLLSVNDALQSSECLRNFRHHHNILIRFRAVDCNIGTSIIRKLRALTITILDI